MAIGLRTAAGVAGAVLLLAAPARHARAQSAAGAPAAAPTATSTSPDDRAAVRRAVLDYVEGFYEGDSTKLLRSVWPEVRKYGYAGRQGAPYRGMAMAFPQGFLGYAAGVREGRTRTPAGAPKEITIFDVQDQTASAKLTAWWGTDYMLLAKEQGRWMITHVLWQTPPTRPTAQR
jgi:hypothetical protein